VLDRRWREKLRDWIDFLAIDFTDIDGNHWVTNTPFSETDLIQVVDGQFFALQAILNQPFFALASDTIGCDGTGPLTFELPADGNNFQRFTWPVSSSNRLTSVDPTCPV
jgi:hypothetical protein